MISNIRGHLACMEASLLYLRRIADKKELAAADKENHKKLLREIDSIISESPMFEKRLRELRKSLQHMVSIFYKYYLCKFNLIYFFSDRFRLGMQRDRRRNYRWYQNVENDFIVGIRDQGGFRYFRRRGFIFHLPQIQRLNDEFSIDLIFVFDGSHF